MPDNPLNIDFDALLNEVKRKPTKKTKPKEEVTEEPSGIDPAFQPGLDAMNILGGAFDFTEGLRSFKEKELETAKNYGRERYKESTGLYPQEQQLFENTRVDKVAELMKKMAPQNQSTTNVTPSYLPSGVTDELKDFSVATQDVIDETQEKREPIVSKRSQRINEDLIDVLPENIANVEKEQRKLNDSGALQYLKSTAKGFGNVFTSAIQSFGLVDNAIKKYGTDAIKNFALGRAEDLVNMFGGELNREEVEKNLPTWAVLPSLIDIVGKPREEWIKNPTKHPLYEFGTAGENFLENTFDTKDFKRTYGTDLASGVGSLAAFYLTGGIGRLLKLPPQATTMLFGALANGSNSFGEVYQQTGDVNKAYTQFLVDAGLGTTEALPIERAFGRMFKGGSNGLKTYLLNAFKGSSEEFLQETLQQFGGESSKAILTDKDYWKELPGILSDAIRSGSIGALTGGAANIVTTAIGDQMSKESPTTVTPPATDSGDNLTKNPIETLPKREQSREILRTAEDELTAALEQFKQTEQKPGATQEVKSEFSNEKPAVDTQQRDAIVQKIAQNQPLSAEEKEFLQKNYIEETKNEPTKVREKTVKPNVPRETIETKPKEKPKVLKSFEDLKEVIATETTEGKVYNAEYFVDKGQIKYKDTKSGSPFYIQDFKNNAELTVNEDAYASDTFAESIKKSFDIDGPLTGRYKNIEPAKLTKNANGEWKLEKKGKLTSVTEKKEVPKIKETKNENKELQQNKDVTSKTQEPYRELGQKNKQDSKVDEKEEIRQKPKATKQETSPPTKQYRIGKSPQLWEITKELPFDPKTDQPGEKFVEVKNVKTGEVSTILETDLREIKGEKPKVKSKKNIATPTDEELIAHSKTRIAEYKKDLEDKTLTNIERANIEYLKQAHEDIVAKKSKKLKLSKETEDLETTAKKYKTSKEFIESQQPIFHGTNQKFDKFDLNKMEGGVAYFTDREKDFAEGNKSGAVGTGVVMKRYLKPGLKLAGYDESDKYSTDELIQQGFAGVKLDGEGKRGTWYEIFNPNEDLLTEKDLQQIHQKTTSKKPKEQRSSFTEPVNEKARDVLIKTLRRAFPSVKQPVFMTTNELIDYIAAREGRLLTVEQSPLGVLGTDGKIYLNSDKARLDTPIHEFGHIWTEWAKKNKPGVYRYGINLIKQDTALINEISKEYPELSGNDLFDEALVTAVGRNGAGLYMEMTDKKATLIERFKKWLTNLLHEAARVMGKNPELNVDKITPTTTMQEFLDAVGKDLLGGKRIGEIAKSGAGELQKEKDQIYSTNFKRWFGDWENDKKNSSKVIDDAGRPKKVYHGTPEGDFTIFKDKSQYSTSQFGYWFTESPEVANVFANRKYATGGEAVYPVYINLKNPKIYEGWTDFTDNIKKMGFKSFDKNSGVLRKKLLRNEFDGIIIKNSKTDSNIVRDDYVVFDNKNVKSAIGNIGTFDPNKADIRLQKETTPLAPFYSKLERVASAKINDGTTPEQVTATLLNNGVKNEEIEWTYIDEFFEGKKKIKKSELMDWISNNKTIVEEVRYGDGKSKKDYEIHEVIEFTDHPKDQDSDLDADSGFKDIYANKFLYFKDAGWWYKNPPQEKYKNEYGFKVKNLAEVLRNFKVSDAEVVEAFKEVARRYDESAIETSYQDYTLPGGENYREILYQLKDNISPTLSNPSPSPTAGRFKGSHFKEMNIIAHVRLKDRTDEAGNKVLFIEEIQSDWAQEGREKGFDTPEKRKRRKDLSVEIENVQAQLRKLRREFENLPSPRSMYKPADDKTADSIKHSKRREEIFTEEAELAKVHKKLKDEFRDISTIIESAPFIQNTDSWVGFAAKNILREAVEGGYQKIAWTTGEMQAERYSLAEKVKAIEVSKNYKGNYDIKPIFRDALFGVPVENLQDVTAERLPEVLGKDLANKIMKDFTTKPKTGLNKKYSGLDLEIGGEGMKEFYGSLTDNNGVKPGIVSFIFNKLGKKWGAKATTDEINFPEEYGASGVTIKGDDRLFSVFSLPITDAMKQSVRAEGFPMFQFIGKNANLSDTEHNKLMQAERMDRLGRPMEEIYSKTGWTKGKYDGEWRMEVGASNIPTKPIISKKDLLQVQGLEDIYELLKSSYGEKIPLYHATNDTNAQIIKQNGLKPITVKNYVDFGNSQGFYVQIGKSDYQDSNRSKILIAYATIEDLLPNADIDRDSIMDYDEASEILGEDIDDYYEDSDTKDWVTALISNDFSFEGIELLIKDITLKAEEFTPARIDIERESLETEVSAELKESADLFAQDLEAFKGLRLLKETDKKSKRDEDVEKVPQSKKEEAEPKEIPPATGPKGTSFTEAAKGLSEEQLKRFFEANQDKLVAMSAYYISAKGLKKRGFTKFLNDKMDGVYKFSSSDAGIIYDKAKGMKMRGMAMRTKVFEPFREREVEIIEDPELAYKPQNVKELTGKVKNLNDTELENISDADLSNYIEGSDNYSTLAGIELINRKIAKGEDYMPIYEKLAKKGTTLGQLINQYKELKSSTPGGMVDMVVKEAEKDGRKLLPPQMTKLQEYANNFLTKVNQLKELVKLNNSDPSDANDAKIKKLKKETAKAQQEFLKYSQALNPGKISDTLIAIMQGNLLTAESLLVNPAGNLSLAPLRIGNKVFGSVTDVLRAAITGKKRELLSPFPDLMEYAKGLGKGTAKALSDIITGSTPDDITKYENVRMFQPFKAWSQLITGKDLAVDAKTGKVRMSDRLNKLFEGTFGMPAEAMFRGLGIGDKPFRYAEERMFLSELGRKQGLKGKALQRFIEYPPKDASELALAEGMKAIFAGESSTSNAIMGWLKNRNPVIRFLARTNLPYIKTPLNIAKETLDYAFTIPGSPIPLLPLIKAGIAYKRGDYREGAINIGKVVTGAILHSAAQFLAESGVISGGPEKEKKERGLQYIARPPFAFNLSQLQRVFNGEEGTDWKAGDDIFTYNRIFGIPGVIMATKVATAEKQRKEGDYGWLTDMWGQVTGTSKFFLDQTFLKGTLAVLNGLNDPERFGSEWLTSMTNVAFFVPNQFAAINRASQDFMPDAKGDDLAERLHNVIKAKTFQTEDLPYMLNIWGQPIKRTPEGRNKWIYNLVDITKFRELEDDKLAFEIMRLYRETNDADIIPGEVKDSFSYGGETIKLSRKQYEKFAGSVGTARRELADGLVNTDAFKNGDIQSKIDLLKFCYDEGMDAGKLRFLNENKVLKDKEGKDINVVPTAKSPQKPDAKTFEFYSDKFKIKHIFRDAKLLETDGTSYNYKPSDDEIENKEIDKDRVLRTLEGGMFLNKQFKMTTVDGRKANLEDQLAEGKITQEFYDAQIEAIDKAVSAITQQMGTGQSEKGTDNDRDKINQILTRNKDKNFVKRILSPDKFPELKLGDDTATHLMAYGEADGKYYVYPTVVYENGEIKQLADDEAFEFAKENDEFIEFKKEEDAMWFSKNYKKVWSAEGAK